VKIAKYIPLNLRVKAPTSSATIELSRPPAKMNTGRGRFSPRKAAVYIPTPKKAAVASDVYPVGPENRVQLTERMIYMKIVVINIGV
jgi:hypothetical protein